MLKVIDRLLCLLDFDWFDMFVFFVVEIEVDGMVDVCCIVYFFLYGNC